MIQRRTTSRVLRATSLTCVAMAGVVLTSCASQPTPKAKLAKSKEYFAESDYGVKASPRVTSTKALLPRAGESVKTRLEVPPAMGHRGCR